MSHNTLTRVVVAAVLLVAISSGLGGVAATEPPDYYGGAEEPDTSDWFEDVDPTTLSGIITMITRVGTYIVGGGGAGISGQLLTGIAVAGIGLGSVARANVGGVAGVVLGITALFVAASTGIAPEWISAVVMFAVGLVLASVFRRVVT